MNKKILTIAVVLVALVVGALTYVALTRSKQHEPQSTATNDQSIDTPQSTQKSVTSGVYTDYDATKLADTKGTILLFFHAPWCPQCRAIDADIQGEGVPDDITVYKVDYDSNQALRQKYGVTLQTTFVKVDKNGDKISSYVAYQEPTFDSVKRELLP